MVRIGAIIAQSVQAGWMARVQFSAEARDSSLLHHLLSNGYWGAIPRG
jgi:hypothetical protein